MRNLAIATALLLGTAAQAAPDRPAMPPVTDATLLEGLELGEEIENRVDGDLNGDGDIDTAFVVASPDARTLYVVLSYRGEVDIGHQPGGQLDLPADALGPAGLTINKGVLVVEDLSGGTTALSATYRYRADKAGPRMRLIGLDATVYSRTYAHDGSAMSWNLVTGDVETKLLKKVGEGEDASYDDAFVTRFKRPSKPVYINDTPDPEEQLVTFTKAK
jgi:hypothetical protein